MTVESDIQSLLRTPEVKEINFAMAGIQVSGFGFWELSHRISTTPIPHRLHVRVNPRYLGNLGNAAASYHPRWDRITVESNTVCATPEGRGTVVHECTHAQVDFRAVHTPIRSEEGAAFVAEAWYFLACGMTDIDAVSPGFPAEIVAIAGDLRARSRGAIGAQVAMTPAQINLARRIMVGYGYPTGHYTSNGIRGLRYHGPE